MTFHAEAFQATQISITDGSLNDVNVPPYYPDGESEPFIPLAHVKVEHNSDHPEEHHMDQHHMNQHHMEKYQHDVHHDVKEDLMEEEDEE